MNELTVSGLRQWVATGKAFMLVDVREGYERVQFNIGGTHIPLGDLLMRKGELDTDTPVVLYCEKGIRSAIGIQRLEMAGYQNLYNLAGGMKAWKAQPAE